jgi:Na+/H+ antiporter NhaC
MDWNAGIWSIVPPIIAIVLALITKEVVFSLILGILSGTVIYSLMQGLGFVGIFDVATKLLYEKLGENSSMIIFLSLLGILVSLVTRAGGSKAYGEWASSKLKGKSSASLSTLALGVLIFIDDYFNCLTVGTVMRPVTDKFKMSREKLAYIIDATAAPVCIIAPISSWAASVISYFPKDSGTSGMTAFLQSVPMNLYAILTLFMVVWISVRKNADYGPMLKAEQRAANGDLGAIENNEAELEMAKHTKADARGRVSDLIIPIAVLIILSVVCMIYVGGYWDGSGMSLFDAFGNTDAGRALAMGAFCTLIFTFIYYLARRVLTFQEFFGCINTGVSSMVGACVILTLAWSISGVCRDLLNTGGFVAHIVETSGVPVQLLAPIIFLIACLLSFATGTAWGTFGILIPIVISITEIAAPELTITCLSATLAGSVFGDHCSPISDTTILASTGASCNHLDHVGTQAPYAVTVAACCLIGYIIAGFTANLGFAMSTILTLGTSFVLLLIALTIMPKVWGKTK